MNETRESAHRLTTLEAGLGALTEKVDAGFRTVGEQFQQVDDRFQQVDDRFQQVDERFDQVDARFRQVDERFDQVDARFQQIDARFDQIDRRFGEVNDTLTEHGRRLDDIEGHFPDLHAYIQFCFGELGRQMEDGFKDSRENFQRLESKVDRLIDVVTRQP